MEKRIITENKIIAYAEYLKCEEKSPKTIEKYLRDIKRFSGKLFGEITKEKVLFYKSELLNENYAVRSINSMIAAINNFFNFAGWFDLKVKPFKIQKQVYCSENKELSKEEYIHLVKTAEKKKKYRLSLIIQTICSTGIRVSELEFITVKAVLKGEAIVSCKGKTRTVFIVKDLKKKLLQYISDNCILSGSVFVTKNGNPINRSNIWKEMKTLCEEAGVCSDKVFPHNLRHLFARVFYNLEKDIGKLADILGHSNINTTRIYIMTTSDEHQRRMEKMRLII